MLRHVFGNAGPGPWPMAAIGLLALAQAGCQQSRFIEEGPPLLDPYEQMSPADVDMAEETMQTTLETVGDNASLEWTNPQTGNGGRFTPTRTYQTEGGYFCRDFTEELTVAGQSYTFEDNHVCRADDGVWRFADS